MKLPTIILAMTHRHFPAFLGEVRILRVLLGKSQPLSMIRKLAAPGKKIAR